MAPSSEGPIGKAGVTEELIHYQTQGSAPLSSISGDLIPRLAKPKTDAHVVATCFLALTRQERGTVPQR